VYSAHVILSALSSSSNLQTRMISIEAALLRELRQLSQKHDTSSASVIKYGRSSPNGFTSSFANEVAGTLRSWSSRFTKEPKRWQHAFALKKPIYRLKKA
jgi:hypothetical protein